MVVIKLTHVLWWHLLWQNQTCKCLFLFNNKWSSGVTLTEKNRLLKRYFILFYLVAEEDLSNLLVNVMSLAGKTFLKVFCFVFLYVFVFFAHLVAVSCNLTSAGIWIKIHSSSNKALKIHCVLCAINQDALVWDHNFIFTPESNICLF